VRPLAAALLVGVLAAGAGRAGEAGRGRMNDEQILALARKAMASSDEKLQRSILPQLEAHHFKSTLSRERETVLFAQGLLQDRMGDVARAAVTYHKLEAGWPQSPFLPEAQAVMAQAALEHGRHKEAESRLNKALSGDIPAESVRRCQELLLWCLADQGRAAEGLATVRALQPLGSARPTEKGLVGILEALCAAEKRSEAEAVMADYHKFYPRGAYADRVELDWGKLLGTTGDSRNAAKVFQKLIQNHPAAPEADEARMALATLLTEGSLPPKDAAGYPDPQALLSRVKKTGSKEDATRRALMINLRIALKEHHWETAMDTVAQFRATKPTPGEEQPVDELRAEAVRGFAQDALDKKEYLRLLPFLDGETIQALSPAQRLALARGLSGKGLPDAARALARAAPVKEQPALAKATLEGLAPGSDPQTVLTLIPAKGENPQESLQRAQAALALRQWPVLKAALAHARPGADRIQALLGYLNRPLEAPETAADRSREVESWLSRATEKGPDREPLVILAADHKARQGDWKGALALYPAAPAAAQSQGWVALMRATCQARLGHADTALATLKEAKDVAGFKNERASLEKRLGL